MHTIIKISESIRIKAGKEMKGQLANNEHQCVILVPLSEDAQERMNQYDIYDDGEVSECFKSMVFGIETEEYMEVRLFDPINAKINILINIYEEEIIENKNVETVLELTKIFVESSDDKRFIEFATDFMDILENAITYRTDVGLYF